MAVELSQVVPLGRSLEEYIKIFDLKAEELKLKILSLADGPASFNAELSAQGGQVLSVDPIYSFSAQEIKSRFEAILDNIIQQVKSTPQDWVWSYHQNPENLRKHRIQVMEKFSQDFEKRSHSGAYLAAELPHLDLKDSFDLALCSHFLFLYSDYFSLDFHLESIQEILKYAPELRIFPLLSLKGKISPYLEPVKKTLSQKGYTFKIKSVEYELQKGGHHMLLIRGPKFS
ncbi:MAG: SAM-dependent methyltransferase [Deltaproteobacteria bacterium]|nr:SAM-dependent methyltransferase [Deltaproteobacteria bacterium]